MKVRYLLSLIIVSLVVSTSAVKAATIGIITDGPAQQHTWSTELFINELLTLTKDGLELRFPSAKQLDGGWSVERIKLANQQLQRDPEVDIVLALGPVSSVIAAHDKALLKPTFAPFIIDATFQGLTKGDNKTNSSGIKNLNYVSSGANFVRDLQVMNEVADCKKIAVFIDETSYLAQPGLIQRAREVARVAAVELFFVQQQTANENLAAKLLPNIDCVVVTGWGRFNQEAMEVVIATLIDKKIPSYSLLDGRLVEQGLLMAEAPVSNWQRLARRTALNIHAVLRGELPENQPVTLETKRRLTINMATARAIGLSPRFDILAQAILINEEPTAKGRILSLAAVAEEALAANLDLRAADLEIQAGQTNVDKARANLWPQFNVRLGHSRMNDDSTAVVSGATAEQSSRAAIVLSQLIYSDTVNANVEIERYRQSSRTALKQQLELDIIGEATTTYLNLLKAQTQITIRNEDLNLNLKNLELARDRQRIGTASPAEVYRWQSQLATSRRALLDAQAQLQQTRNAVNRLLHRPLKEAFIAKPATLEDPRLIVSRKELFDYVNNDQAFERMGDFMLREGIQASPEIASLDALLDAVQREVKSNRRAYWSPTITLEGEVAHVLEEERQMGLSAEDDTDWSVGVNISLPLFEGGGRYASLSGSRLTLKQLATQRDAIRERVEQGIRASLHAISASYPSIQLSKEGATAAKKNLELVTDAYSQGTVSILDLLDAQNAALVAEENATNAIFDFLIDLMNLQRRLGRFDFFLDEQGLNDWLKRLQEYIYP